MDLYDIERSYGCVAEYNRSRFEDEAHAEELRAERNKMYAENRKRLQQAVEDNLPIIYYGGYGIGCDKCEYAERRTATDDEDDIERVICKKGRFCQNYRKNRSEQIGEKLFTCFKKVGFKIATDETAQCITQNLFEGKTDTYLKLLNEALLIENAFSDEDILCLTVYRDELMDFVKEVR